MASATNSSAEHASSTAGSVEPPSMPSKPSIELLTKVPRILPHERVFPIQIGSELFKLSGASLSSDAPSYFSQYFLCQLAKAEHDGEDPSTAIRTLYIDRDPVTFKDISLHLQGYHVKPQNGTHFVRLFADAQFYNLPRLISQLYDESIFMSIGHREFQIPRELFNGPGNSPNYFSLGFAMFFSSPDDLFPGLEREGLLRPPSILPPSVPNKSADTFVELLHLLRGYPLHIRDEEHRASLLKDCRYFNFKGLEQKLILCNLSFNQSRRRDEIYLLLEDVQKNGLALAPDHSSSSSSSSTVADPRAAWVAYSRPFLGDPPADLVFEVGDDATRLHFDPIPPSSSSFSSLSLNSSPWLPSSPSSSSSSLIPLRAEFFGERRIRLARLLELVALKLDPPAASAGSAFMNEGFVSAALGPEASVVLDGKPWEGASRGDIGKGGGGEGGEDDGGDIAAVLEDGVEPFRKRRRTEASSQGRGVGPWIVKRGQWRLRIRSGRDGKSAVECVLVAVKLEAVSCERESNAARGFLSG